MTTTSNAKQYLILGGARSGKSSFAERLIEDLASIKNGKKIYLATATAGDDEMAKRIAQHQAQRDERWLNIEEPIELAQHLKNAKEDQCILVDCLTLWLSNCLYKACWAEQKNALLEALRDCPADVVMVSNEVGSGIIPMGELSRQFVDESGWLHQTLAQQCSHVSLIVAGLESVLKSSS